ARAVVPHAYDDLAAVRVDSDRNRVHYRGVDGRQVGLVDELAQPRGAVAEVERVEPLLGLTLATRDRVERLLHRRGEVEVDEMGKVSFQQLLLRERSPRWHERAALLPHVVATKQRLDHARVCGRAADAALLELLHETRFGVSRGWLRAVSRCLQR